MAKEFDYDQITTHDRLVRAWENSMELTRDFQMYSKRIPEGEIADIFKEFAEDEGMHATKLRDLLTEERNTNQISADRDLLF